MCPPRRKKWTEAEERTLIDKYGAMVSDGTLAKMKTREKKFRPIALHVNSAHHSCDPITYPWQWTWKDVSTKVQNMRHQYLLVKQKIKKHEPGDNAGGDHGREEFDWVEGLAHWSNFLRYKAVFGDVALVVFSSKDSTTVAQPMGNGENGEGFVGTDRGLETVEFGHLGHDADDEFVATIHGGENGVLNLGFDYEGEGEENYTANNNGGDHVRGDKNGGFIYEEVDPNGSESRKKRKVRKGLEKRTWGFLANQLQQLREMEAQFEQREAERERERQRRQRLQLQLEQDRELKFEVREREREEREKTRERMRRQFFQEWETMDKQSEDREIKRREEELNYEREWEERTNRRRLEWKKRLDEMMTRHREEMGQLQSRILHEQQNVTSQLLGIISQWTGQPTGLADHTGSGSHYLSQMMHGIHGDSRVEEDNQDDQFIVDG